MTDVRDELNRSNVRRWLSERSAVQLLVLVEELGAELLSRCWPGARCCFELARVLTSWRETAQRAEAIRAAERSSRG